jgi:cytochrome c oxidase subunit 3
MSYVEQAPAHAPDHHDASYEETTRRNRMGLWLFFVSEIFLFGGMLAALFYLWQGTRPELDQGLALLFTTVLLISSFSMARAEQAIAHGDRRNFSLGLIATFIFGLIFLLGVVFFEWGLIYELGIIASDSYHLKPGDGAFGAMFFLMTGMHALHVLSGLIIIALVWINGQRGGYSAERHWGVEAAAIYWHYVDLVWIFFYPALYLIGSPVPLGG